MTTNKKKVTKIARTIRSYLHNDLPQSIRLAKLIMNGDRYEVINAFESLGYKTHEVTKGYCQDGWEMCEVTDKEFLTEKMKLIREMFPDVDIPTSRKIAEAYFYGFPDDVLDILESVGYTL